MRRPQCVVIAGPNGAGKTVSAPSLLHDTVGIHAFVNADVIAQGLSGFRPEDAAIEAGRIMLSRLQDLRHAGADFAFESTLAGRSAGHFLARLRGDYDIHLFYLWLPSLDLALARVRHRVASGGHDVPEHVIRRRFWRGLVNFDRLYRPLVTTWRVYDGSTVSSRRLVAHGSGSGAVVVDDGARWAEIQARIEEHA